MKDKVFFLGAGFSKAICPDYPLLKDLTRKILENLKNDPLNLFGKGDEKLSVKQHFQEIPKSLTDNIEELLTYLSSDLPWKNERQKAMNKALYIDLTDKIVEYFHSINNDTIPSNRDNHFHSKLSSYIFKNKIPCISLNYDLLLEELLCKNIPNQNKKFYSKFYKIPIQNLCNRIQANTGMPTYSDICNQELSEILKLHGSINWLYSGLNSTDPLYCSADNDNEDLKGDLIPYLIPPILDKNSFYNHNILKYLWYKAHDYLKEANEIYIIGFSFPLTDLAIRFLFQSALRNNNDVKVYVINPDKSNQIKNTYKQIFPKSQLKFDYCGIDNPLDKFINDKILNNISSESI